MDTLKFFLGSWLLLGGIAQIYPVETKEVENNFINSSKVFQSELKISEGENLSTVDFKNIFGPNPGEETPITRVTEVNNDFKITVMPLVDEQVILMKIGNRAVLFSPGKKVNVKKILEYLGKNQLEYVEAIIVSESNVEEQVGQNGEVEYDSNIMEFIEMGLTNKVIITMPSLEKKTENFEIMNRLYKFRNKVKEKGATVISMSDKTKISFMTAEIQALIEKEKTKASFVIKNLDNAHIISNGLELKQIKEEKISGVDTYIIGNNEDLNKEKLNEMGAKKIIITNTSKDGKDLKIEEIKNTAKEKGLKDEDIIEISSTVYAEIEKPTKEVESKTNKKNV